MATEGDSKYAVDLGAPYRCCCTFVGPATRESLHLPVCHPSRCSSLERVKVATEGDSKYAVDLGAPYRCCCTFVGPAKRESLHLSVCHLCEIHRGTPASDLIV